ncbi:MAG: L-serine ammonia-lyase, iron-sulfur-dependent, subunit alpha [Marinilabiliaceae bacterium]|jgi:L-serine dehydratase|nr:L-serine ammonia-lyase, iron-sulfur-dependent, subunit alpha [Marinilabiliaceae bacterium]
MKVYYPSIFNNVIGPVMRGPSSSHTAAALRIGKLGLILLGETPSRAVFRFDPNGSLATTYRGQGSAMGLAAGLLGMEISDPEMINAENICSERGMEIEYRIEETGDSHPNTYVTYLQGSSGEVSFRAVSTGGGMVRLVELNGKPVEKDSEYINQLLPVKIKENPVLAFSSPSMLESLASDRKLSDFALEWETAVGDVSSDEVYSLAVSHMAIIRESYESGMAGTDYEDRILGRQSHLLKKAPIKGDLIPAGLTNRIIEAVTAIMETKSSMGLIVAAPTAGSAGAIGGVLLAVAELTGKTEDKIARSLLAAGMTGVFIALEGGFAAEEGGCQYECGAASGMAAAALTELMGGDAVMAMNAASMALQNTLGMICDPVANRVEVPCLGKNIMAAQNALSACNMIIAGFNHVIPLEEVIRAMKDVGTNMDHRFRCTCKGGLSITDTARRIDKEINK